MTDRPVNLPRHLYGRQAEEARLEAALAEHGIRAVVASGPAGVGKTALLAEALARAARAGALTGTGKHTQGEDGEDLSPFIEAMEQAVTAGLEQLYDPDSGMESLGNMLGAKAAVFATLGSGLLRSLKAGPLALATSAEAADERVVQACIATLRWLHGFDQPIILQIDDWGRASERTVGLYRRLVEDPDLSRFRLLASERAEEASSLSAHPLCDHIVIGPIDAETRREIVADMLGDAIADPTPLLDFLGGATERPFDLIHGVQGLALSGGLVRRGNDWVFDPAALGFSFADAVPESTAIRLISSHAAQLAVAQTLAMFGDTADVDDLALASGQPAPDVGTALSALEKAGLVRWRGRRLSLTHDRLRLAVLETLDANARRGLAARIADALLSGQATPGADPRGAIMLRRRLEAGLGDIDAHAWADLFQAGALAARQVGDRNAADAFAEAAMALADRAGGPSHAILKEGVFAAVERSDHALAIGRADRMPRAAANAQEAAEADELRVFAKRMSGDLPGAIEVAREGLARAGIRVPTRPTVIDVALAVGNVLMLSPRWARRQRAYTDEELAVAAPMMRAINAIGSLLFEQDLWMAVILGARSVPPALAAGTAAGAGAYAYMCAVAGQYRRAAEWAELSDLRQSPSQPLRAVAMQYARSFGHWFVRPHRELFDSSVELESLAYGEGDLAVAAYANKDRIVEALLGEGHLAIAIDLAERGQAISTHFKDIATSYLTAAMHQAAVSLMSRGKSPWLLQGAFFDPKAFADLSDADLNNAGRLVAMLEAILAVSYGAYEIAVASRERSKGLFRSAPFQGRTQTWTFVTALALYRTGGRPSRFGLFNLRRVAKLNPTDNAHRILLLDAEAARLARRERRAMALYERAVEAARNSSSWIESGIVAEAAAEGAVLLGRPEAARFAAVAHEAWRKLGADGVIAVRRAASPPALDQLADMEALRAEVHQLQQHREDREWELETARIAAERANRAKSRFLATIGHELRTPLQGLVGLVDLAQQTGEDLDIETLGSVVGHFKAVVNDLTDLGALEGGVFPLALTSFDPAEVCRGVVMLHQPSLRESERSITLASPTRRVVLQGDEVRVGQILSNLVGNAVKHAGGDIRVRLGVRASGLAATVTVDVSDEGPGLDETALVRLFEPFERGDGAASEGLGLGLPLARALARRMGGDILVSRTRAGGTRFRLLFDAALSQSVEPEAGAPLSGARVLLAEDAPLSRRVIAALLRAQGCTVVEAADGRAAIDLWRAGEFDLVLLDLRMPVLDGLSVARIIRKEEPPGRRSPIIIATAAAGVELEQAAAALSIAAVLQKPIGWRDLAQALGRLSEPAPLATPDRLGELRAALGPDADLLFAEAIGVAAEAAGRIRSAADAHDHETVEREAHRLAGLASNFGLDGLRGVALDLEAEATDSSTSAETVAAVERAAGAIVIGPASRNPCE